MQELLDAGLLHGDCMTVTGKTIAENLAAIDVAAPDGEVIHAITDPIHRTGGITVLRGSLAPDGAVVTPDSGMSVPAISADQASLDPSSQPWSARGPPAGSVLITAAAGGTATLGAARVTFAPGALPVSLRMRP